MPEKIGVFVCDCGNNISDTVDTKALAGFAGGQPDVVEVRLHRLWCSEEGREEMKKAIKEKGITRAGLFPQTARKNIPESVVGRGA